MDKTFYTPKEVAALLGLNPITVYRWLNSGTLRGIRVGPKRWRIPRSEIDHILEPLPFDELPNTDQNEA
jgi:excisionase family DNA binding protein